jgi:hypothetical protein
MTVTGFMNDIEEVPLPENGCGQESGAPFDELRVT